MTLCLQSYEVIPAKLRSVSHSAERINKLHDRNKNTIIGMLHQVTPERQLFWLLTETQSLSGTDN